MLHDTFIGFQIDLNRVLDLLKIELEHDLFDLPADELAKLPQVPSSLEEALNALEEDHDFLLKGGVFTEDVISAWINFRRENDVDPVRLRPHPYEFFLLFDA